MNFNWRDRLIRNIPIDKVAEKIAALGIPGLVLIVFMTGSGLTGGAAIVAALAAIGGTVGTGMLGGIAGLGVMVLISSAISRFGSREIFKRVLKNLKKQGKTKEEILQKIDRYPIDRDLKLNRQVRILCPESDMNIEMVLKEGLNMVLIANNKPPIA